MAEAIEKRARPLVRCEFGVRAIPLTLFATPIVAGGFTTFLTFSSCGAADGAGGFAVVIGGLVSILATIITGFRPLRLAVTSRVAVDEGGVRVRQLGVASYWPLQVLGGAKIEHRMSALGDAFELLDRTGRPVVTVPLWGRTRDDAERLVVEINQRIEEGTRELTGAIARLKRKGRLVSEWLHDLREEGERLAEQGAGFRGQALDTDALLEAIEDPHFIAGDRAAAAYLLLCARSDAYAERVQAVLDESSPPLLLAVCAVASSKKLLRDPDAFAEAVEHIDDDDRRAIDEAVS